MKYNWFLTGGLALVFVVALLGLTRPTIPYTNIDIDAITKAVQEKIGFGSLTTNEIVGTDRFTVNGVTRVSIRQPFKTGAGTTTPCSIPYPIGTSTLASYSFNIPTGTSTAAVIDIGTSTSQYATSALNMIQQFSLASGAKTTRPYVATTSDALNPYGFSGVTMGVSTTTSPDNPTGRTYIVLKTGGGTLGTGYAWDGASCQAEFLVHGKAN